MRSAIWVVALPVFVQQMAAACIGLVDAIFAGRLPHDIMVPSLDAISIGSYVTWFVGIAMTGLGIGGQALIARAMGAGDPLESHRALGNATSLSVAWGLLVGVVMWVAAPGLGMICRLTPESAHMLTQYVRIISWSMPLAGVMLVGSMCLYGAGETTRPAAIAVASNVVNIVLSWALSGVDLHFGDRVLTNPFTFDMHLDGIAMGTSLSFVFGGAMILWALRRGVKDLRLEWTDVSIDRPMLRRLVRVGLPGFMDSIMMWSANLLVLLIIGMVAAAAAAPGEPPVEGLQGAHLIAIRWESFSFLPGFAIGTAAGALAGQYLGAGSPARARQAIVTCTGFGALIMGVLGLVFIFGGRLLTQVISSEPVHLARTPDLLFICGTVQVFFAITMVLRQGLRGVGDTRWTFIITTGASFGIRLPAAWALGVVAGLGLKGVWIGLCGEIVLRAGLFSWRFLNGGWQRIEV